MTTEENKSAEEDPRSFVVWLGAAGEGDLNNELSKELHKMNTALQDVSEYTNNIAKGTLTVKFKLACDPRGVVGIVMDVKNDAPKRRRVAAQAWMTKGNNQQFTQPRQEEFKGFRDVSRRRYKDESEGTNG